MDPNQTLEDILTLMKATTQLDSERLEDLISKLRELDEWLSFGGFLPERWGG